MLTPKLVLVLTTTQRQLGLSESFATQSECSSLNESFESMAGCQMYITGRRNSLKHHLSRIFRVAQKREYVSTLIPGHPPATDTIQARVEVVITDSLVSTTGIVTLEVTLTATTHGRLKNSQDFLRHLQRQKIE